MSDSGDLITFLNSLEEEASVHKDEISKSWKKHRDYYKGKHWPDTKMASYKKAFVANFFTLALERNEALLTDSNPTIKVVPRQRSELKTVAGILTSICESIWYDDSFNDSLGRIILNAELFGSGLVNVAYDPSDKEIILPSLDPENVLIDPYLKDSAKINKAEYIILSEVQPLSYILKRFKNSKHVTPDMNVSSYQVASKRGFSSLLPRKYQYKKDLQPSAIPRATIQEFFLKDRSLNMCDKEVQIGSKWVQPHKELYPTFRHILRSGNVILVDERCPYWDGNPPIELFNWRNDLDSVWGRSEAENLLDSQETLNKMLSIFLENAIKMSNVMWIGDRDALDPTEWDSLTDAPGAIVKKNPGRELRRESPVALPPHYLDVVGLMKEFIKNLSNETDVSRGEKAGKLTSGQAVETLQMAAQTLIRKKARLMESFLMRVFQKVISRIFQFYTTDRLFYMFGKDGKMKEFMFIRNTFLEALKKGKIDPQQAFREFRFTIAPGSSLNLTRVQRSMMASQLFQMGAIDEEALLEQVDFPDRDEVSKRVAAKKQQAQQFALQQAQIKATSKNKPKTNLNLHGDIAEIQGRPRSPDGTFAG